MPCFLLSFICSLYFRSSFETSVISFNTRSRSEGSSPRMAVVTQEFQVVFQYGRADLIERRLQPPGSGG